MTFPMEIITLIAEQRIREAMDRGEFDNLPGKGRPVKLEDDSSVPDELRVSYKVLKNAGCIPPELELRKEILNLRDLLKTTGDEEERQTRLRELNFKLLKFNMTRKVPLNLEDFPEYEERIIDRLAGR